MKKMHIILKDPNCHTRQYNKTIYNDETCNKYMITHKEEKNKDRRDGGLDNDLFYKNVIEMYSYFKSITV